MEKKIIQIDNIANHITSTRENCNRYRVYSTFDVFPTLTTMSGGSTALHYSKEIKVIGGYKKENETVYQMRHRIYSKEYCFPTILANIGGFKYLVIKNV